MKVKCAIPSRIKECAECEHYVFPYIVRTSGGETVDSPPSCRAGRDLATQKAPCPNCEKRMPCIYMDAPKEKSLLSAQKIWADKWKVNNRIVNGSRPHKVLPREQK